MNCCNPSCKCRPSDYCPVRATRDAVVCSDDGIPVSKTEAALLYLVMAAGCTIMAALVAGVVVFAAM